MKLLGIGNDDSLPKDHGFGKLPHAKGLEAFADVAIVAPAAETAAALELSSFLSQSGKRVVLALDALTPELRAQAFGAGAVDVISGALPADVVAALLRTRLRAVEPRLFLPVQAGARLFGPAAAVHALITDVSFQGFHARIDSPIPRDTVVRVQPAGTELPSLFARIVESASGSALAAWTGLFPEERERLAWFLTTLSESLQEGELRLTRIAELRYDHLLVRGGVLPGPPLPPLTDAERDALHAPNAESDVLSWIALARMRASALASALTDPSVPHDTAIEGATHREIMAAEAMARDAAAAALAQGAAERNRALTEVHKRVAQAMEALERVSKPTDDTTRRQPLVTADGEAVAFRSASDPSLAAAPAAPSVSPGAPAIRVPFRARTAVLAALALAIVSVTAWRIVAGGGMPPSDVARTLTSRTPLETIRGVRVEKVFDMNGATIGVVDGSWFEADDDSKEAALRGASAKYGKGRRFAFRDAIGREIAWIDSSGNGFYVPDPDKTYRTP